MSSHDTRETARKALADAGYTVGFSSPGRPELWIKGRSRMVIARRVRDADEDWVTLPYPEPATATPDKVRELAARDGVVLSSGKLLPQPAEVTPSVPPLAVDPDSDIL